MIEVIRQVVTREQVTGGSEWASTGVLPSTATALDPGAKYRLVWGTEDGVPTVAQDAIPVLKPFFPGPGGTRFIVVRFPAAAEDSKPGTSMTPAELHDMRA